MPVSQISTKRNQKSLDDRSQEMLFEGLNLSQLGLAFNMDIRAVQQKLHGVAPSTVRHGSKVWLLADAAPYLVKPKVDVETYIKSMSHSDLPKHLTKEFWAGQRARQEFMLKEGDLWPTPMVVENVGELMKVMAMALKLLGDTVDRQAELTPKQRKIITEIVDATLKDLVRSVEERFGKAKSRIEAEAALVVESRKVAEEEDDDESL